MSNYVGISIFLFLINIGLAFVSIHYRNNYEEIKKESALVSGEVKDDINISTKEVSKI